MEKFSFFRIIYGKKLYGKLSSVPVNCSLTVTFFHGPTAPAFWLLLPEYKGVLENNCGNLRLFS